MNIDKYDKCELLIRTQNGRIINLGRIMATSVGKANNVYPVITGLLMPTKNSTTYLFRTEDWETGDYDGDELFDKQTEITPAEWENILKE